MKRILCSLCISLVSWQAFAGEVEDSFNKFKVTLQNIEEQAKASGKELPSWEQVFLSNITQKIAANDLNAAKDELNNFNFAYAERQGLKIDERQKQSLVDLRTAIKREQEKRDNAEIGSMNTAISAATSAVKKAKTAADLDACIEGLEKAQMPEGVRNGRSKEVRDLACKENDVLDFVTQYQEYLSAKAGGYDERAREIAKSLTFSPARLIPRSELLAKAYEPKGAPKEQDAGK